MPIKATCDNCGKDLGDVPLYFNGILYSIKPERNFKMRLLKDSKATVTVCDVACAKEYDEKTGFVSNGSVNIQPLGE